MRNRAAVAADLNDINFVAILGVATALVCTCDADSGQADSVCTCDADSGQADSDAPSVTALDLQGVWEAERYPGARRKALCELYSYDELQAEFSYRRSV